MFFFKPNTAYEMRISDWSSDVCSSDLCVGVVYDRLHTRIIARYEGLAANMPRYAFTFMIFMLASVGLPGTGGFVGEFLVIVGAFQVNTWVEIGRASCRVRVCKYV